MSWLAQRDGDSARAARYADLIRHVCPAGPYRLGGWSFGGVLAFEVARQLVAEGSAVEFVGMLDANPLRDPITGLPPKDTGYLSLLEKVLDDLERHGGSEGGSEGPERAVGGRCTEHVDEDHVRMLAAGIKAAGVWTAPVPVEAGSGFVMDGNHRLAVARRLNLRCLPCIPLRYGDPGLEVRCWTTGRHYPIADLLTAIGRQELLPFKSTRHLFNPPLPGSEIPLALLREGFTQ
jgi:hypothetical protein